MTTLKEETPENMEENGSDTDEPIKETTDPSTEAADESSIIDDKDDTPSAEVEPESTIPLEFALTADSTSLCEITNIIVEDDGDLFGNPDLWDEINTFLDGDTKFETDKLKLEAGQELFLKYYAQYNRAWSGVKGTFAEYAIALGIFLIKLKSMMKACGEKWEPWAAVNLPFISPRTRQAFMQLAKTPGIDKHAPLGKERLLLLISATKGMVGDDPVGDFLKTHNLAFDPEEEIDLDAYKEAVDLALDYDRLKKAEINLNIESLKMYRADGKKVDASLIRVLKAVEAADGDPNKHLTNPPKGDSDNDEEKAKSFKKIATSLVGTINWISEHKDFIKEVDVAVIDNLTTELSKLKRLIIEAEASKIKQ